MNRHVEVVGLEVVGHLAEALERVLAHGLLEAERLARLAALLCDGRSAHHREAFTTAGVCVLSGEVPLPHTWGSASLLWARPAAAGSGRRCGSCHHSRHTAGGGPPRRPAHMPCTCTGRSASHTHAQCYTHTHTHTHTQTHSTSSTSH